MSANVTVTKYDVAKPGFGKAVLLDFLNLRIAVFFIRHLYFYSRWWVSYY